MSLFVTCWIWKLSLQVSGLSVVYTTAHFYKCQHTLTMFPSLSQTTTPRFGDRGDGPMVSETTGVKNAYTVFTRHKLDQEMILRGWPFHTLCQERQHYAILGKKLTIWGAISGAFWVLLFCMDEVTFSCLGRRYLGFIQQGNKQVYNYSFEKCFKRVIKY